MEILHTTVTSPPLIALLLGIAIVIISGLVFYTAFASGEGDMFGIGLVALAFGAILLGVYFGSGEVTRHEVLIHDFNEVYEQGYEIVGQRGDIYIIEGAE